jgi:hypothetical protein
MTTLEIALVGIDRALLAAYVSAGHLSEIAVVIFAGLFA